MKKHQAKSTSNISSSIHQAQCDSHYAGLILAGGKNTRMNGQNKALLIQGDRTLIEHVACNLYAQTHCHLIAAGPHNYDLANKFIFSKTKQLSDTGESGPLEGVVAGLNYLSQYEKYAWLVSSPCDTPILPTSWVAALKEAIPTQTHCTPHYTQGAYVMCHGRHHYAHAIWPVTGLSCLQEKVASQQLSLRAAHQTLGSKAVDLSHLCRANDFSNINTPCDLTLNAT